MPSLLRRRINCFYCGKRTSYTKGSAVRKFECASCDATNYLDENGDIADVPTTPSTLRPDQPFSSFRATSSSPPAALSQSAAAQDPTFCAKCLKNQHVLNECLANYLPDESDPRYDEYDRALPEYKRKLEKRYPPVCLKCEPRVRARLRKTAYATRSDDLARALARPAKAYYELSSRPWWMLGLDIARLVWWLSLLIEISWHFLGALGRNSGKSYRADQSAATGIGATGVCLYQSIVSAVSPGQCSDLLLPVVVQAWLCGLLVAWWHPGMTQDWRKRATGQGQWYALQIITLVVRAGVWYAIAGGLVGPSTNALQGCHIFMLLFLSMIGAVSRSTIKPGTLAGKVSFKDLDKPLVDHDSFQYPQDQFVSQPAVSKPDYLLGARRRPAAFPIGNLAPKMNRDSVTQYRDQPDILSRTSTEAVSNEPEPEADPAQGDSMDWEPVQPQPSTRNLRPRTRNSTFFHNVNGGALPPDAVQQTQSPFYGSIPAAPKSMEHRVRNAANTPAPQFHPVPASKKQDFFQKMKLAQSSWATKDYMRSMQDPDRAELEFAEPKWTLKRDLDAAANGTGLEDLFTSSFKIDDDSRSMRSARTRQTSKRPDAAVPSSELTVGNTSKLLLLPLVIVVVVAFLGSSRSYDFLHAWEPRLREFRESIMSYAYGV